MSTLLIPILVGLLILLGITAAARRRSAARLEAHARNNRARLAASWAGLLDRSDVLILDTETTGLGKRSELVEIALVDTRGTTRLDEPVLPLGRIPKEASDIHGLTRARLRTMAAGPWPEVDRKLEPVVRAAGTVLIWNAEYDIRLIRQTVEKHKEKGYEPPASAGNGRGVTGRCVMQEYASLYRRPRIGLDEAAGLEGITLVEPRHRALGDVLTVLAVMRSVVQSSDQLPPGWTDAMPAPQAGGRGGWRADAPTTNQISYARSLLERNGRDDEYEVEELEAMSKGEVSDLIGELQEESRA